MPPQINSGGKSSYLPPASILILDLQVFGVCHFKIPLLYVLLFEYNMFFRGKWDVLKVKYTVRQYSKDSIYRGPRYTVHHSFTPISLPRYELFYAKMQFSRAHIALYRAHFVSPDKPGKSNLYCISSRMRAEHGTCYSCTHNAIDYE